MHYTDIRSNIDSSKLRRQISSIAFSAYLAQGITLINVDESVLDRTCYTRKALGKKGTNVMTSNSVRLRKVSLIGALLSDGRNYLTVNSGINNQQHFWLFILKMVAVLEEEDPNWRNNYRFLLDNAAYHRGAFITDKLKEL
jgi:hypothetical protein